MRIGYCITSDETTDYYVGIRFNNGIPEVLFPHGYNISTDEKERRKDVFRLLGAIKRFSNDEEGERNNSQKEYIKTLPLTSYQYIMNDFLLNGYYTEKEIKYVQSPKGKIDWKRTVQKEQAHLDENNVVYLNFQVKTNKINENNVLTRIHQYCVYQSFLRFGWLYFTSDYLPPKPPIKFNKRFFSTVVKNALDNTFNDSKRKLFQSMLNIILENDEEIDLSNFSIGVKKFEGVWENLIDYIFGEPDKEKYFPHATWHIIKRDRIEQSSPLRQDTIMKHNGKFYVLDAKYYQYGISYYAGDLPKTDSIQKQITYGKHIANMGEVDENKVYNAFIMPYSAAPGEYMKFIGVGTADWEKYDINTKNYAYVLGILIDTKTVIANYSRHNEKEIEQMADLIEESIEYYRNKTER